jgi:energy-converting hydrogenase Eha subunit H
MAAMKRAYLLRIRFFVVATLVALLVATGDARRAGQASSTAVKNEWFYTSTSPYVFMAFAGNWESNPRSSRL